MQNNNKSLTFVYGSDGFLVDRRSRFLFKEICNNCGEILTITPEDPSYGIKNALSAVSTISLFAEGETIWIKNFHFYEKAPEALVNSFLEALKCNHGKQILISAIEIDKRTKVFKELEHISTTSINANNELSTVDIINIFAKENGTHISENAAQTLKDKCGNDVGVIEQEITKLSLFIEGTSNDISVENVLELVDDLGSEDFFEAVEKFFLADLRAALSAINKYFFCNNDARPLISAFLARNRLLIQLKSLANGKKINLTSGGIYGKKFSEIAENLHMSNCKKNSFNIFSQNTWFISKLVPSCLRFSLNDLLKFQTLFIHAFDLISGQREAQLSFMKKLVTECLCDSVALKD